MAVESHAQEKPLSRIAFGSCANQDRPQPIWEAVVATKPELFLFIGDNIYADTDDMDVLRRSTSYWAVKSRLSRAEDRLARCWRPGTTTTSARTTPGPSTRRRQESQKVFLDFFGVPKDDLAAARRACTHARTSARAGKRVQIILLDTRYFRSPLKKGFKSGEPGEGQRGVYVPDADMEATMLGEKQWKWLEEQLDVPAEVRIIASSIQFVADEHGSEKWGNFPHERAAFAEITPRVAGGRRRVRERRPTSGRNLAPVGQARGGRRLSALRRHVQQPERAQRELHESRGTVRQRGQFVPCRADLLRVQFRHDRYPVG